MSIRVRNVVVLAGAFGALAACAKAEKTADTTHVDTTHPAAATPAPPVAPQLTDANILAMFEASNSTESAVGAIAAKKGTHADVRKFGTRMMHDHHALNEQGAALAKKITVTPEMPSNDSTVAMAAKWRDSLTAMAKSAEWDKAYIDHEVTYHEAVLQFVQTAAGQAQNPELKEFLTKTAPAVQGHLDLAKSIQSKLNAPATAASESHGKEKAK